MLSMLESGEKEQGEGGSGWSQLTQGAVSHGQSWDFCCHKTC